MSGHSGINKIISAAALLFTVAACTSTVQPRPHQRPTSTDPVPVSPSVSAPPSRTVNVAVTGLALDAHRVASGQRVTITGPVAARRVSGRFTAAAPAGDRFFALTTPFTSASTAGQASYVQGEIVPAADGSWSAAVSIGTAGSYPAHPDRLTIVLAGASVAATLAKYEGRPGTLRPVPALPWRTLAMVTVTREPSSVSSTPIVSMPPAIGVAGLVVDRHPVASDQYLTITGPVAARRVSGRFTAAAPAGDRFFALTTPLSLAASYVQGEIVPAADGSWSVMVSIGATGSYPAHSDRVTIVLASPSVAATLASHEGRPGTLRPVPAMPWRTLVTVTVTRKPSSTASSPSPLASPSPAVGVAGLTVDGHPVTSGQRLTITGLVAARRVSGRFTAAAPAGDRFFALTTPFTSASTAGQASYVQGEITPGASGSWSVTVSIGSDGRYPAYPDRVTIVLASPSVAATLTSYEGQPGTLRPVPALAWKTLATVTITREPPSAPS